MEVVRPNLYSDTDSERYTAKPTPLDKHYKDCMSYIANDVAATKSILNSRYGVQTMNKLHNRPYIVIHQHVTDDAIRPAIIFIDMIASIEHNLDGTADISILGGKWFHTNETYTDIVRKLFNN